MAGNDKKTTATDSAAGINGSAVKLLSILGVGSAIVGFGVLFSIWWRSGPPDAYETLRIASREYVNGQSVLAGDIAEKVVLDPESEEDKPWNQLRLFLVSAAEVQRARETEDRRETRIKLHDTIGQLRESAAAGYPAGREGEGYQLIGETLYELGRFEEAAVTLRQAITRDPTLARKLTSLIAIAELKSIKNSPSESLATIESFLQDSSLDAAQVHEAETIQIESLLELGRYDDARQVIDRSLALLEADPTQLRGVRVDQRDQMRLLKAVVDTRQAIAEFGPRGGESAEMKPAIEARLRDAIDQLTDVEREATPRIASQARLWAARAFLCQGDPDLALTELTTVRQQRPFGSEACVGALEEIELLAQQGRGLEMLQTTRYVVRELGDPRGFDSSLISFASFRQRLGVAIVQLRRAGDYKYAIDISRSLPPLVDANEALLQEATGYREWADATVREGTNAAGDLSRSAALVARGYFRAAGDAFAAAAKLDFDTPRYLTTLWSAIDAYQNGRHFTRSVELLQPYLRYEERTRQSRGMVAYGRALLADGEASRAIETLNECIIEFPRDPLRYDARLLAALAYDDLGQVAPATKLLTDNLQDGELTPQSPAWRDSLFSLGEMSFRLAQGNELKAVAAPAVKRTELLRENQVEIKRAIRYLDEAVERYWPSERAQMASYLRNRAHTMASVWPQVEAGSPEILDAARRALQAQSKAELELARDGFATLSSYLSQQEEEMRLPESAESLLRNSLIFEADTLRSMKRWDEAVTAYRALSVRYINEPVALEAMLGQARCVKELGRVRESEGLIRQAAVVLERIPPEFDQALADTTRYDRAGWKRLLGWMTNRFDAASNG